ncbi:MAG TPA: EAL domain-containing protein [Azospirillaceae bacterium]|nr:EAL domain-containing protein [Azospirillaceae bacterium]
MSRWARYLGFAFANADLLLDVDPAGRIGFASGASQALLGRPETEITGTSLRNLLVRSDRALAVRLLRDLPGNGRLEPRLVRVLRGTGADMPCMMGAYRLEGDSHVCLTLTRAATMAEQPAAPEQDDETGVLAAGAFAERVATQFGLEALKREPERLTLIRIGNLGEVRSKLGEAAIGRLMEEVGGILRCYAVDDTGAGRLAEDRFGVLHDGDLAESMGRQIAAAGQEIGLGGPLDTEASSLTTQEMALSKADKGRVLLHVLRRFAEDGTVAFDPNTSRVAVAALVRDAVGRVSSLRDALAARRMSLHYQPIVSLETGKAHHLEALVRFEDAATGPTVSFAEEVGMASDLDLIVTGATIDALERAKPSVQVAVNLSAESLVSDIFMQSLTTLLRSKPGTRGRLMFELTESATIRDTGRARAAIDALRRAGYRMCLDDFGAGASSFPYLQEFEVDMVKLDGAYIGRLGGSARDDAILRGMLRLCHDLKVGTIAEKVETVEQAARLRAFGCDYGQGWLFAKPGPRLEPFQYDIARITQPSRRRPAVLEG